ncbi:GNAT family N-acetyltransferase [Paenibacillus agri]|uniref:GNAT family N-acetyltransferase n=1 Tax=Paenibacillus agri TaxID=2744309 RepID=A0A850ENY0_9BACL|nr:GNAT family N-acetyltransferase [Paenibacillus agri]NUU61247.1 GNAT family N-acetyltransferase [Paenibacillus agri]
MNEKIKIREFTKEDSQKISTIIRDNLAHVNSKDYPEKIITNMYSIFTPEYLVSLSERRKVFVAVMNNTIIGTISLDRDTIYTLFVDKDHHHLGIGRILINFIEGVARNTGITSLKLPSSITAQSFYEKLGYHKIDVVESEEYGRDIIMMKNISE